MGTAELVLKWRENAGLSQHEAAKKLHVSQAYYSKVELGKRAINPKKLGDWLDGMDLPEADRNAFLDEYMREESSALAVRVRYLEVHMQQSLTRERRAIWLADALMSRFLSAEQTEKLRASFPQWPDTQGGAADALQVLLDRQGIPGPSIGDVG